MKLTLNITFKTWRTWFELSTLGLAFTLLLLVNGITLVEGERIGIEALIFTISWIGSVLVGLRKY